ncbi:diacylglycerol kinase [Candidatus Uhrbacteria bacterium]|nr:diacylglycerol kinase [Candidatus Uhrbacteria bacterium]
MRNFWVIPYFIHGIHGLRDVSSGRMMKFLVRAFPVSALLGIGRSMIWGALHIEAWIALWTVVCFMWAFECLNTAVEELCNLVAPGHSEAVRRIKDLGPAAGICLGIGAVVGGLYVLTFNPGQYTPLEAWQILVSGRLP